mmetsp:Transcript_125543/g.402020  ORF Transcript_125543/g.402020 Transcript_125543/m.402020 type:complete len:207 (+) Transcript_125543:165-785(+)
MRRRCCRHGGDRQASSSAGLLKKAAIVVSPQASPPPTTGVFKAVKWTASGHVSTVTPPLDFAVSNSCVALHNGVWQPVSPFNINTGDDVDKDVLKRASPEYTGHCGRKSAQLLKISIENHPWFDQLSICSLEAAGSQSSLSTMLRRSMSERRGAAKGSEGSTPQHEDNRASSTVAPAKCFIDFASSTLQRIIRYKSAGITARPDQP